MKSITTLIKQVFLNLATLIYMMVELEDDLIKKRLLV